MDTLNQNPLNPAQPRLFFYVYPSAFQNPGGGEVLLLKTREYLEKQNIRVHLFDMWRDKFQIGDLLHVFGSVKEALGLMETARSRGVRIIHSPIIWYNWQSSLSIAYGLKERALCILRQAVKTGLPQIPSARKKMIQQADIVIAGSEMEKEQIQRYFLIDPAKVFAVHYGVDEAYAKTSPEPFIQKYKIRHFVLMAGRIEPRKNQLALIRALKGTDIPLVILGSAVSWHKAYEDKCRAEAGSNVHFIGQLPPDSDELKSAFAACSVFALPSWFETPGLAALEAGLAGAKVVITREGPTHEYFGEFAEYVNPGNVQSIRNAVLRACKAQPSPGLQKHLLEKFTWTEMAKKTIALYRQLGFLS